MSEWINIDELGTKGMEPDEMTVHRDPQSLDLAVNVRAQGKNLANAGGYAEIPGGEFSTLPGGPALVSCTPVEYLADRPYPAGYDYNNDGYLTTKVNGFNGENVVITAVKDLVVLEDPADSAKIILRANWVQYRNGVVTNSGVEEIDTLLTGPWSPDIHREGITGTTKILVGNQNTSQTSVVDWLAGTATALTWDSNLYEELGDELRPGKIREFQGYWYSGRKHPATTLRRFDAVTGVFVNERTDMPVTGVNGYGVVADIVEQRLFYVLNDVPMSVVEINPSSMADVTTWTADGAYISQTNGHYGFVAIDHFIYMNNDGGSNKDIRSFPIAPGGGSGISLLPVLGVANHDFPVQRVGPNMVLGDDSYACTSPAP